MKNIVYLLAVFVISACGKARNDAVAGLMESAIEKTTGYKVDTPDINDMEKNKVTIELNADHDALVKRLAQAKGVLTGSTEGIAISISGEENEGLESILIGFSAPDITSYKPIHSSENITFSLSMVRIHQNAIHGLNLMEGSGEIQALSEKKVVVVFSGKVASPENSGTPDSWIPIEGKIIIDYPIYSLVGLKKEDLIY